MRIDPFHKAFGASALVVALVVAESEAQVRAKCILRGRDTVLTTGVTVRKCLDLAALDAKTVVIPSNVDSIAADGFSLCENSVAEGGQADIVYVNDQSGSMRLSYVWISPDARDTVWLHSVDNCNNAYSSTDRNNFGKVTVLRENRTVEVNRLNPAKDPRTRCFDYWSGDPFYQRGIALKAAIDFQAARAPNSRAGYLGFSNGVVDAIAPRLLNTAGNVTDVKNNIRLINEGSTNYKAGLDQAKKWLNNPVISPNFNKAVIFISDGKPSPDSTGYLEVLSTTYAAAPGAMPKVYGIFLGVPRPDTIRLAQLSQATGGQFYLIPPDRPDSLKTVVERILNVILRQYQPHAASLTNTTVIPNQTGRAASTDFTRQGDGSWRMRLDRTLSLLGGNNAMDLQTQMKEIHSDTLQGRSASFTLSATGPEEGTNRNLPGTQFGVNCVDLPPEPNLVKKAYIRDTDENGTGDKIFLEFTRPLAALPPSLDTAWWNQVGEDYRNKVAPTLSFLPGSQNTVVVADFTVRPFGKDLTGIPLGANPVAVLPNILIFVGQRPPIDDSIGPVITTGKILPYDPKTAAPGGTLNIDTLMVTVSEPMTTSGDWQGILLWGKKVNGACNAYETAVPLVPYRQPIQGADGKTFTVLVDTRSGTDNPLVDDCIYLSKTSGQTDLHGNVPARAGLKLDGRRPARVIEMLRAYPPVAGTTPDNAGFILANNDTRTKGDLDYSRPDDKGNYQITWVPPVGFVEGQPFRPVLPANPNAPSAGTDASVPQPLPKDIAALQVLSTGKYIADVTIFDNHGHFIKKFRQAFGYNGELNNGSRTSDLRGWLSYLVWDLKDSKCQWAGNGVYVWKAVFTLEGGKQEIQYTRTGVMRDPRWTLLPAKACVP